MSINGSLLPTIQTGQAQKEVICNQNFIAVTPSAYFSINYQSTTGLTYGYYGGNYIISGTITNIVSGTLTLADNSTNYIQLSPSGIVSSNTSGFTNGYFPMQTAVTLSGAITTVTDYRICFGGMGASGIYLPLAGGTMTGAINMGSHAINNLLDPVAAQDAATKNYVDQIAIGITVQGACYAASTANLTGWTYNNGSSGVGATLTAPSAGLFAPDGVSIPVTKRFLYKNDTTGGGDWNGIYTITTNASGSACVITRATDYNLPAEINPGDLIVVENGTLNGQTSWLQTATVTTIGSNPIQFSQFTFAPSAFVMKAGNAANEVMMTDGSGNVIFSLTLPTGVIIPQPIIQGIISGSSAASGVVGELISSVIPSTATVSLPVGTVTNITSITLTAGDWDTFGNVYIVPASGAFGGIVTAWSSITSATKPDNSLLNGIGAQPLINGIGFSIPTTTLNISSSKTVYLSALSTSTANTACGAIYARRRR